MSYILEKAVENVADQKEAMGIILHADAMDDAQKLRQMLVEKLPEMDIRIYLPSAPSLHARRPRYDCVLLPRQKREI